MVAVGSIYRAYRDGRLTGDDEVALIHAPERLGWAPLTVPLVEVRATLVAACRSGLTRVEAARAARRIAQAVYFGDRDWPLLEKKWVGAGVFAADVAAAIARLHVPLKQRDALACIAAALAVPATARAAPKPPQTWFLDRLIAQASAARPG
jgi:hypothetical protein